MPTAFDRLLASPSALRTLRAVVEAPELPPICFTAHSCCHAAANQRKYLSNSRPRQENVRNLSSRGSRKGGVGGPGERFRRKDTFAITRPERPPIVGLHEFHSGFELRQGNLAGDGNAAAWAELLQHEERVYGRQRIREVWHEMQRRGFRLPIHSNADSDTLWSILLRDSDLVTSVLDHAEHRLQETGQVYPHLYEKCMAYWLPRNPQKAQQYHHLMMKLQLGSLPLRQLTLMTKAGLNPHSLEALLGIYKASDERDMYDHIVPELHNQGHFDLARRWHIACFQRQNFPSADVAAHPVIQSLMAESATARQRRNLIDPKENKRSIRYVVSKAKPPKPKYNRELLRRLADQDIPPVRFDDRFCARLFATRVISPTSIINGLNMVGVNEIGPQAVRAMALRSDPITELPERFQELKSAGIALQGSVYCLALEKFAMEGKFSLVRSMLESDQHPDVFGELETQKKLLNVYLRQKDWTQAHRTLAILSLFHNDASTASWNVLFQAHIQQFHALSLNQVIKDMGANGVFLTGGSLAAIKGILRSRRRGRKVQFVANTTFDDLRVVTRIYMSILESGVGLLPPFAWTEIMRRYGMHGRLRELRRLVFWLLSWYAPRFGNTAFATLRKSPLWDAATEKLRGRYTSPTHYFNLPPSTYQLHDQHPVRQLFPPRFQQALIIWGFRAGLIPNAPSEQSMLAGNATKRHFRNRFRRNGVLPHMDWSVGLRTLVELRDAGVHVEWAIVTKALQSQFIVLFGRGRSNKVCNRVMKRVNTISYESYVREVNRIWGKPLFYEPELGQKGLPSSIMWHPRLPRKEGMSTRRPLPRAEGDHSSNDALMTASEQDTIPGNELYPEHEGNIPTAVTDTAPDISEPQHWRMAQGSGSV